MLIYWQGFLVEFVKAGGAWPFVVLFFVVGFNRDLSRIFRSLAKLLNEVVFKYEVGPAQKAFEKEIGKTDVLRSRRQVQERNLPPVPKITSLVGSHKKTFISNKTDLDAAETEAFRSDFAEDSLMANEIFQALDKNPASAIIKAWDYFDKSAQVVLRKNKNLPPTLTFTPELLVTELIEAGILHDGTETDTLRAALRVRNAAVHGTERISPDIAFQLVEFLIQLARQLKKS